MPKTFPLADLDGILRHARGLGYPVLWTMRTDGVSGSGAASCERDLRMEMERLQRSYFGRRDAVVTLATSDPSRLPEAA